MINRRRLLCSMIAVAMFPCACHGDPVGIIERDATVDVAVDAPAKEDARKPFPDGRVCEGHDEDNDGFPDDCDDCPNVPNPAQLLDFETIGEDCKARAPFEAVNNRPRLFFDPFRSFGLFQNFGKNPGTFELNGVDEDSILGGNFLDSDVRFVVSPRNAKNSTIVATTLVTMIDSGGQAGILLRVSGDSEKRFYACDINLSTSFFSASHAPASGCNGGPCDLTTFMQSTPDGGSALVSKAMPRDLPRGPGKQIGLRASITSGAADGSVGGIFECRVFDPSDPVKAQAGLQGDENGIWVLRVPVDAGEWIPSGEVGLFAQRTRASFSSLDVMQAP